MKLSFALCLVILTSSLGLAQDAPDVNQPRPENAANAKPKLIPAWGTAMNPLGDCEFYTNAIGLVISVPGLPTPHDLAAEIGVTNAPYVVQPVKGDFTIQVKIEGRFTPGDQSTKEGRASYNGGGLVLMADPQNVITLARAVFQFQGDEERHYVNYEMRSGGQVDGLGSSGDHPLQKDQPVYLRLERRGMTVQGAVSVDGANWDLMQSKEIPATWPQDLQAGVAAISSSKEEFNPRFSRLQMVK